MAQLCENAVPKKGIAQIPETGLHCPAMSETTIEFLRRRLRLEGAHRWPEIALRTGMSANTLRKMAYGDRKNPRLATIEPLLDYFRANPEQARDAA